MKHTTEPHSPLFDPIPVQNGPRQGRGVIQSVEGTKREHADWQNIATAFLVAYAGFHPEFIAEDVVTASNDDEAFPPPPDDRAWGAVFNSASRSGVIRKIGYKNRSNGSPCAIWTSTRDASTAPHNPGAAGDR